MKKAISLSLSIILLCACLFGCAGTPQTQTSGDSSSSAVSSQSSQVESQSSDASAPEEWYGESDGVTPVTLQIWGGVQPEYGYAQMVENFNAEYESKGIQIEYIRYVNDPDGNLQVDTYLLGGGAIDAFIGYGSTYLLNRAESGLLLNLTDRFEALGFDCAGEFGEASMSQYWVDGDQIYGVPSIYSNNRWMLVNVDMFNEANIDIPYEGWTYEEFYEACKVLTKGEGIDKRYGAMWCIKQDIAQPRGLASSILGELSFYSSLDGTKSNFDNEIWADGLSLIHNTMFDGYAIPYADEVAESLTVANTFLEEKCAISMGVAQLRLVLDRKEYPHDFQTALVPGPIPSEEYMTDEYKYHTNYSGTNDLVCIANDTQYPEACFEFLMWYVTSGMAPVAEYGRIPLWKGFDTDIVINALSGMSDILDLESLNRYMNIDKSAAVNFPVLNAYSEITTVINEEIEAILLGAKTVEEGLDSAQARADELIS